MLDKMLRDEEGEWKGEEMSCQRRNTSHVCKGMSTTWEWNFFYIFRQQFPGKSEEKEIEEKH